MVYPGKPTVYFLHSKIGGGREAETHNEGIPGSGRKDGKLQMFSVWLKAAMVNLHHHRKQSNKFDIPFLMWGGGR